MLKNEWGQSGHETQKWTDGMKSFFYADANLGKRKFDSIIFVWANSKMAMAF